MFVGVLLAELIGLEATEETVTAPLLATQILSMTSSAVLWPAEAEKLLERRLDR